MGLGLVISRGPHLVAVRVKFKKYQQTPKANKQQTRPEKEKEYKSLSSERVEVASFKIQASNRVFCICLLCCYHILEKNSSTKT